MKKVLVLLALVAALVLCLVSCSHIHNFGEWSVTKNATCAEEGVKTRYCDCGEKQSDVVPAIKHNYIDGVCLNCHDGTFSQCKHDDPTQIIVVEDGAPTCQEAGLTPGMKCNLCGTMVVPQAVAGTICCSEGDWIVDLEATKSVEGLRHKECTMCGIKMIEEVIPATGSLGLQYSLDSYGVSYYVKGIGTCTDTEIIIPSTYNGLLVTSIGEEAFSGCTTITSVFIPDSVKSIGDYAFAYCTSLTNIELPVPTPNVDDYAIYNCSSLLSVSFNGTIEELVTSLNKKGVTWLQNSSIRTMYCVDGQITSDGHVTYK